MMNEANISTNLKINIKPFDTINRLHEIRVSGLGGQGVILTTHILGVAGMFEDLEVMQIQKYGPENRGSKVVSHLLVSPKGQKIWLPIVTNPTFLCAMAQLAYDKSARKVKHKGIILYDADTVKPFENIADVVQIPFPGSKIAIELKNKLVTNIVFLGGMLGIFQFIKLENVERAIKQVVNPKFHDLNITALRTGYETMKKILNQT